MTGITVEVASRSEWSLAIHLLSGGPSVDLEQQISTLGEPLILLARSSGDVVGALLSLAQVDGTLFVWPPGIADAKEKDAICDALLADLRQRIDGQPLKIAQTILEPEQRLFQRAFARNGFTHFVDLDYLEYNFHASAPAPPVTSLTRTLFDESANKGRFAAALERSYINTLDCPEMSRHRTAVEALTSHQQTGQFTPEQWSIFSANGDDVGVLLMNSHPEQGVWEVVYVGVDPAARGKGYGEQILRYGLHAACMAGAAGVMLAVDMRNRFARSIYAKLGFESIATRVVFVRFPEGGIEKK